MTVQASKTYRDIIEEVATQIYDNTKNTSTAKYNAIPDEFKSVGHNKNEKYYTENKTTNGPEYVSYWRAVGPTNAIPNKSGFSVSVIKNDIINWLNSCGYDTSTFDNYIDDKHFVGFFNYMIDYISRNLVCGVSNLIEDKILYFSDNDDSNNYEKENQYVSANNVNDMIYILENIISLNLRIIPMKYEYSLV